MGKKHMFSNRQLRLLLVPLMAEQLLNSLMGPMAVWIGMFADWTARAVIFSWRYFSRRWLKHQVV